MFTSNKSLLTLTPTVKNDLICVGGRINRPDLPNSNNQIIICKSHPTAKLLVNECHEKNVHIGREHTLAIIRKKNLDASLSQTDKKSFA